MAPVLTCEPDDAEAVAEAEDVESRETQMAEGQDVHDWTVKVQLSPSLQEGHVGFEEHTTHPRLSSNTGVKSMSVS